MPLRDAVKKLAYGLLKFPQIADTQDYPVAEAQFKLSIGTDDEAAKQLNLAVKLAEREQKPKRVVQSQTTAVVVGEAGRIMALRVAAGKAAVMPMCTPNLL